MMKLHLQTIGLIAAASAAAIFLVRASGVAAGPARPDLELIAGVMQLVQHDYVHPIASDQLTQDALKGMLGHLDPHSSYMSEREFEQSSQDLSGKFGGIGLKIEDRNGVATVVSPIDGTPAAQAGLQPGDMIVAVDGQTTHGMGLMQVVLEIRGKPGTNVKLGIVRGGKASKEVSLIRKIIEVNSVRSKLEPGDIGYIRISEFGDDTPGEFKRAIATLKRNAGGNLKGLVLDLRDDPGGLVSSAVDVSGDFLDGGTVVSIHGRRKNDDEVYKAPARGDLLPHTQVAVLVNSGSASASEIVAGALQDRHRATVMGTQSFGKGSVQSVIRIKGHGALRLTTALYYTPSGRSIQGEGISPDIVAEAPKDERVASSPIWRESQLHGAFKNPGPLSKGGAAPAVKPVAVAAYSPPIKESLIGTGQDAQLSAALKFLQHPVEDSAGQTSHAPG
jgi:carboxyl-terminal processing protease